MRRTDNSRYRFMLALLLLGGSAAIGILRDRRGAQVFSKPVFEAAAPTMTVQADAQTELDVAPSVLGTSAGAAAEPAAESFDAKALSESVQSALAKGRILSALELQQLRALYESEEAEADADNARKNILRALLDSVEGRVPAELLSATPTLLAALEKRSGPLARKLKPILTQALDWENKFARTEVLLRAGANASKPLELALANLKSILAIDPSHPRALAGVKKLQMLYLDAASRASERLEFAAAESFLQRADGASENRSAVALARTELFALKARTESELLSAFESALMRKNLSEATSVAARLAKFIPEERSNALNQRIKNTELYGGFSRGERFADALGAGAINGPEMRVIPIGSFVMGSAENEPERSSNEGPQREISVNTGFALSISEISVGQFALFAQASGYVTSAETEGWSYTFRESNGRFSRTKGISWRNSYRGIKANERHPVVHISHSDANAYAAWLSEQTGYSYRLPTEAEFEYALRAGSTSTFWWGTSVPDTRVENLTGERDVGPNGRRWSKHFAGYGDGYFGPAPTKLFKANAFGVMDMGGNVAEWVADCWHDSYARAPDSIAAWVNQGCAQYVVRGGSWGSPPSEARSAFRQALGESSRNARIGFRVARQL